MRTVSETGKLNDTMIEQLERSNNFFKCLIEDLKRGKVFLKSLLHIMMI